METEQTAPPCLHFFVSKNTWGAVNERVTIWTVLLLTQDVDAVTWLSDQCANPETYAQLVNASHWPAWQKYRSEVPGMTVPATYGQFYNLSCVAGGNVYADNVFCRAASVVHPVSSPGRKASTFRNNTVYCEEPQEEQEE